MAAPGDRAARADAPPTQATPAAPATWGAPTKPVRPAAQTTEAGEGMEAAQATRTESRRPPEHLRLFIALWPDAAALRALQAHRSHWTWPAGAKPVAPDRVHLTVHFLGQVARARLDELRAALAPPALALTPFALRWSHARVWPRGLAVLLPSEAEADAPGLQALHALHARLGEVLRQLGMPVEARPFRPHLTLARAAQGATPPAAGPDIPWPVRGYALVQSEAGYRTLQRYG
jgi:2'-5' RNA ligase